MNITEIRNKTLQQIDYKRFNPVDADENSVQKKSLDAEKNAISDRNSVAKPQNWKNEILLQGLDMLENKIQVANSSTLLDKPENKPIETFAEAMSELELLKTDVFKEQASGAQANISPQIVYDLLMGVA